MKITTHSFSFGKKLLILCLFLLSFSGFSQNFTVTLANGVQTSPSTFEVDIVLTSTTPVRLASVAFGINYNTGILNGAAPCTVANCGTWSMVPNSRTAAVATLNATTNTNRAVSGANLNSVGHLRATMTNLTAANSIDIPAGVYTIGRYRFANTLSATDSTPVPFTTNSNANLWIQPTNASGNTNTIVSFYPFGATTPLAAYTTTSPAGGTGLTLSHTSAATFSLPLNVGAVCATSATTVLTPETCAGAADGTATITMVSTPTDLDATYSLDGGTAVPVVLTAGGNFTITGLASGSHTLVVTGDGCATPVTVTPFTITTNPTLTPTFTQVGAICSGATLTALPTTSNNGVTGTWAPALDNTTTTTYTFTPSIGQCATTATMTITVNPNVTPTFTQVADICSGATLTALPTTSNNGITGTWAPALDNTTTTTYTFTPVAGQCGTTATMTITVNPSVTPTFTQVAPICNGGVLTALPTTSNNGITGTWAPALDNTTTTTYTFTPTSGVCVTTASMTITVNPILTPTFTQVADICAGATLAALPTTSNNGVTGTWAPALDNTTTTTYTFTPGAGQCASTATMTITVAPNVTPTFTQVADICAGATLAALPTTSNNGVTGTWAPALDNTTTTTYTFTPGAAQCGTTTTMTITVNPSVTPTFTQVAPICSGDVLTALPTTSNNGITGTWAPALDNTTTTTYTFTPGVGPCATTATMTITVTPTVTPTFTQVAPICSGATLAALPTTSNNGVTGTWAPAVSNTATTTYTFTPSSGSCVTTATMTIVVNPNPVLAFTANPLPVCAGTSTVLTTNVTNFTPTVTFVDGSAVNQNFAMNAATFGAPVTAPLSAILANVPSDGCTALTPGSLTGKIALIQRGVCGFAVKAQNAQDAGAIGVLLYNNVAGALLPGGAAPGVTIPVYGITQANGLALIASMTAGQVPVTLSPAPVLTYLWGGGQTTSSINTGNLNVNTDFTVTVTNPATGCSVTNIVTVPVTPNIVPTFDPVTPICAGQTLTALPTTSTNGVAGTWAPALDNTTTTTYTFTPTPVAGQCLASTTLVITVNPLTTNGSVTTTACGSYTWPENGVTYTTSQSGITVVTGCNTATLNLTIVGIDYANLQFPATQTLCQGQSFTAYGQVYEAGITDVSQTLQGAGIDVEFGVSPVGGSSDPSTWTNWSAASYNATSLCYPCNNDEYQFTTGASLTAGTYYYTFRYKLSACSTWQYGGYPNGFWNGTTQNSGVLTINSAPTPTGSATQSFSVVALNDATIASLVVSPTSVTWYGSLANAQSGTNPLASTTVITNGSTYWAVNTVGGCSSTPFAVTVTVTLGNNEFDALNFTYAPNPTSSLLNISYSKAITEIQVTNMLGQVILTKKTNDVDVQIDLSSLAAATYFVKVTSDDQSKIVKVIKKD